MSIRDSAKEWGIISRLFHWGSAIAIFGMIIIGITMINLPLSPLKLEMFMLHKSLGMLLLLVALLRITWRLFNPRPSLPNDTSHSQKLLVKYGQLWIYLLLVLIPISGWVINSAANFPLRWFSLFEIPAIAPPSVELEEFAKTAHLTLLILLGVTITGHIIAALHHHRVLGNNVLLRMLGKAPK